MLEVLSGLLAEGEAEVVTTGLLEAVLRPLVGGKVNPAAQRVAARLLQRCEAQLKPALQRFLLLLLTGQAGGSSLKGQALDVIYQVGGW